MEKQLWILLLVIYSGGAHVIDDDPFPMHTAAIKGNLLLVKHLLEGGAPINQQNTGWFYTPLHYAAYYGREDVVRYLLVSGASKTIGNFEGHTALDVTDFRECYRANHGNHYCKEDAPVNYDGTVRLLTAECLSSIMCRSGLSCVNEKCVNICNGHCGINADCLVVGRQAICTCKNGYSGIAEIGCHRSTMCNPNCLNGECTRPNFCQCRQGWTGNRCQTRNQVNQHLCYVPTETDTNVTILKCGAGEIFDIDEYRTIQHYTQGSNCVINNQVPMGTKAIVSCWRSPPIIAQCNQDSSWDECNANYCQSPITTLNHLCKQEAMNAQYCGYRPPYTPSSVIKLRIRNTVKKYPWLVGIFVNEKYVCTGTLISVRYVLTAAHCTSGSLSSSQPIDKRDVKVQHIVGGLIEKRRINKIIHHPWFKNGKRPVNDISLLRLEIPVTFSAIVMPSCIAKEFPAQIESAVAFDRSLEEADYDWDVQLQKIDNRCTISGNGDTCQQLKIENQQFCSTHLFQLIPGFSSTVRKGASGGPFLVNTGTEEQEKQSLLGVASYRVEMDGCEEMYTVYTNVAAFSHWISLCLDAPLDAKNDCYGYEGF